MELAEIIKQFWPIILTIFVVFAWFIRLEAKVMYLGRDHEKLEISVAAKDKILWEKIDSIQTNMTRILEAVARLDGRLAGRKEVSSD